MTSQNNGRYSADQTLQSYFEDVYRHERLSGSSRGIAQAYRHAVKLLVEFAGDVRLRDVTAELLGRWQDSQALTDQAQATIRSRVRAIRAIVRRALPTAFPLRCNTINQTKLADYLTIYWASRRPVVLEELTDDFVNAWLMSLEESDRANATVRCRRMHLLVLWRAAHLDGLCDVGPLRVRKAPPVNTTPRALRREQVEILLAAAGRLDRDYPKMGLSRAAWWDMAIRIAWDLGCRQGDQFRIRTVNVSTDGTVEFFMNKVQRWQIGWLDESTMEAIRAAGGFSRKYICPWDYTDEHFRKEFKKLATAAGLAWATMKTIRKSSASNVEANHTGAGSTHLGHAPGSMIGHQHYFDRSITEAQRPRPEPLMVRGGAA